MLLDGNSSQGYPLNTGVRQGSIPGPTLFLLYLNDLPDDVICDIAINTYDTTLYSKCDQASNLWQQLKLAFELECDAQGTVEWGMKWLVDFSAGKTQLVSFKLGWGSYIISIAKTSPKKIGALIRSIKFLSPKVALYLYKSTIHSCVEYCFHVWAGAPSCFLELLDKLKKRICRTVGPSLAASLEPFAHHRNVASLMSLFNRHYFGRCSSERPQLVPLPFSRGRFTLYSDRLYDFSVTILRC